MTVDYLIIDRDQKQECEQTVGSSGVWFEKGTVLISQCVRVGDQFSSPHQNFSVSATASPTICLTHRIHFLSFATRCPE